MENNFEVSFSLGVWNLKWIFTGAKSCELESVETCFFRNLKPTSIACGKINPVASTHLPKALKYKGNEREVTRRQRRWDLCSAGRRANWET